MECEENSSEEERKMCNTETTVQVPSESSNPPGENSPVPEPVLTVPGSDEVCQNTPVQSAAPCEEARQLPGASLLQHLSEGSAG